MGAVEPTLRSAGADDQGFLAWALLTSTRSHLRRGYWDVLLPDRELRAPLLRALTTHAAACHCHHGGFLIAELGGEPVGALCGYEPLIKSEKRFERALLECLRELGVDNEELAEMEQRAQPFALCKPEFPDDCWIVEGGAVRPEARGSGAVDRLLEAILQQGRELGYGQAQLAYMLGNDRAERVYERHGFHIVAARTDPSMDAAVGSAGVGRMKVAL